MPINYYSLHSRNCRHLESSIGPELTILLEIRLSHGCLSVNFAKFFRIVFYRTFVVDCFWLLVSLFLNLKRHLAFRCGLLDIYKRENTRENTCSETAAKTLEQGTLHTTDVVLVFLLLNLTLSWRGSLSYSNQSIDFQRKSMDWFLYDRVLRHEIVKQVLAHWLF